MNRATSRTSSSTSTNPDHYKKHSSGIECIVVAEGFNFNLGNVIKYVWRAGYVEDGNPIEDLKKAVQYLQFEIKRLEAASE